MGANTVLLLDTLYNNDSVIRATSKVMSDSELVVEYLETTVDHTNKYNKVVQYGTTAWCCVVMSAGLSLFGVLTLLAGLTCMEVGVVILNKVERYLNNEVTKMVEDKLLLQVKQLKVSIMELETVSTITLAINGGGTVIFINYKSYKSLQDTIKAANLLKSKICSKFILLRQKRDIEKRYQKISNKVLPIKQTLKGMKISAQLLDIDIKEEYYQFAVSQNLLTV
ncbi:uncharacterized protein [Dysidea avara]|uniref:uncharacterized protein n=1 Tax=Dysidea avara TaxID=196820 RepID=UPI00332CE52B